MPKILRIVNRFNLGGITYNAAYLTKYLSPDFETMLIGGMKDASEESSEFILKNFGLEYRIIPEMKRSINPLTDFLAYRKIKKIIKEFKPDIVHTHAAKAGAVGRQAAFACNVPVTVHTFHGHVFHSYFGDFKTTLVKNTERSLAKKTSAIIAISEKQKKELAEEHHVVPAEKIHVIPLGFDLERFHQDTGEKRKNFRMNHGLAEDEIAIGIIGRLVPVKNHSLFIEAVKYVSERSCKKVKAFIIGDGEERLNIESKIRSLHLEKIMVLTSWEKEVDKVYPGLDIVCLTSFNEGTPVSLIEAQAANRPVVSTKVGGIENVVLPNITALLSEINAKNNFAENLLELTENDTLRKGLATEGWNHVREKFHFSRLVQDTAALYRSLIDKHRK